MSMELFVSNLFENPAYYFSVVVAFAASICVHEFCHAFVAHRLGDDTAKEGGFMTLNPLKVMGWMSIAALLLFGFSWGAVPVRRDHPSRWRRSAISLAGPLSNLALLGAAAVLLKAVVAGAPFAAPPDAAFYLRLFLICALYANAILFLFNIVPIPPLDGWGAVEPFLPPSLVPSDKAKNVAFTLFIYLVCFSSTSGIFDRAVEFVADRFMPAQITSSGLVKDGHMFWEAGDYENAFKAYEAAAEAGNAEGLLLCGLCLSNGMGCEADPARAFAIFTRPDILKVPLARCHAALLLMNGLGCEKDETRAFAMMNDPEVLELPAAQCALGMWYWAGLGTEQDFAKAAEWLKAAAEAGAVNAAEMLGYRNGEMPDYGMPLEEWLAQRWRDRADGTDGTHGTHGTHGTNGTEGTMGTGGAGGGR